ncbi:metallophosphoesterase [Rhizorhabdus argentea]|uniref:metallophosphoesterase n=1 Tax=Rhizorhabdus argentea TaxID=1387174 RepID=UPI0030EBFF85
MQTAKGERIYAIGDIHGRYDLLRRLLLQIKAHHLSLPRAERVRIMVLGDFVDRGPDSARVLKLLFGISRRTDILVCLLGNHEDLMLDALAGMERAQSAWLRLGGDATLQSFGITPDMLGAVDPRAAAALMRSAITQPAIDWMRTRPLMMRSGNYIFCHAGLRPGTPILQQTREDLLWIRGDFLESTERFEGSVVVHGHSISAEVEQLENRIGIDTGAYRTGVLTALYLEGRERAIISTGIPS